MANNTKKLSRLIDSIDILGTDITVNFTDPLVHEDGDVCMGLMHHRKNLIEIWDKDDIPYENQLSTLLHECIECIVEKLELDIEHRDITSLETAFFQLMRKNPALCKAFALYQPRIKEKK